MVARRCAHPAISRRGGVGSVGTTRRARLRATFGPYLLSRRWTKSSCRAAACFSTSAVRSASAALQQPRLREWRRAVRVGSRHGRTPPPPRPPLLTRALRACASAPGPPPRTSGRASPASRRSSPARCAAVGIRLLTVVRCAACSPYVDQSGKALLIVDAAAQHVRQDAVHVAAEALVVRTQVFALLVRPLRACRQSGVGRRSGAVTLAGARTR